MQYIRQSLGEREKIIHVAEFHWMYNVSAAFNILFSLGLSIGLIVLAIKLEPMMFGESGFEDMSLLGKIRGLHPGIKIMAFIIFIMGILRFVQMMVVRSTTEIAVTNNRLVYKRGLVARYVGEINTDRIEGVNVLQGVLGRIFDYGRVMVRGMGVGEVVLPPIAEPIKFRRAIEKARAMPSTSQMAADAQNQAQPVKGNSGVSY